MFDRLMSSVISVDADLETIHFYNAEKGNKGEVRHSVEVYKTKAFDGDFYELLKKVVKIHKGNSLNRAVLIMPDSTFFTDTIKIPVVNKKSMTSSLGVAIDAIYSNARDIKYKTFVLSQNKQVATYGVLGVRKEVLNKTISAIESEGVNIVGTTFATNSTVNGAIALNGKLKNSTYMLVDVKERQTRFALVISGRTCGFYSLPFGFSTFSDSVVNDELKLFDHFAADLLVLDSKEKAKKSQPTSSKQAVGGENSLESADLDENEGQADEGDRESQRANFRFKRFNRKLPKYMLRDEPTTDEGYIYENFRPILKWTLELLKNNPDLTAVAEPKNVYVNMPNKYSFIFDKIKDEGNLDVSILPLCNGDVNPDKALNLELFGGFYLKKFNKFNNV